MFYIYLSLTFLYRSRFKWLKHLKGYFSDIHEQKENVVARIEQIVHFMDNLEPQLPVFIIVTGSIEQLLVNGDIDAKGNIKKDGKGPKLDPRSARIRFKTNTTLGLANDYGCAEFHIDSHPTFAIWARYGPVWAHRGEGSENFLGGYYSYKLDKGSSRFILCGQDETVVSQNIEHEFCWHGTNGERILRPKSDGIGGHVSGIVSRQIGWRPHLSDQVIAQVKENRQDERYKATDAALTAFGATEKRHQILDNQNNPFYRTLIVGANNDGYWSSNQFIGQLEDLGDLLPVLMNEKFPNLSFKFWLAVDHSQNHLKKRPDGLFSNMRVGWEYEQKDDDVRPHNTTVPQRVGPHQGRDFHLAPGAIQVMWFDDNDPQCIGPFDLSPEEREERKYDRLVGDPTTKNKTCAMLKHVLTNHINNAPRIQNRSELIKRIHGKRLAQLQLEAEKYNIPTTYEYQKKKFGWAGKEKGSRQILAERGWISPVNPKEVTKEGKHESRYCWTWHPSDSLSTETYLCIDRKEGCARASYPGYEPQGHVRRAGRFQRGSVSCGIHC